MSIAQFVPAVGEQLNSVWVRELDYHGFDLKFFTDKSHFKHKIALQCAFYGINGVGKGAKTTYREMIGYPKDYTLMTDSVDCEETIVIRKKDDKNFKHIKIGEFVDRFLDNDKDLSITEHQFKDINGYEVLTIDDNFKVVWKEIKQVIRHKVKKQGKEILTIGGRIIKITNDHSLMQFKDINTLKSVEGKNVIDYVLSYDKLDLNETDIEYFEENVKYYKKLEKFKFDIEKEELIFLGYIIGDGNVSKIGVGISGINEKGLYSLLISICKKYKMNLGLDKNGFDCGIPNTRLSQILNILGINGYSYNKSISDWILNLPKKKLGYFLNGYFSADGSIILHPKKDYITEIGITTVSKKLHLDTKLALDKLNIKYNIGICDEKIVQFKDKKYNARKGYKINIYDIDSIKNFNQYIGFNHLEKIRKLKKGIKYFEINNIKSKLQHGNLPCNIVDKFCKYRNQDYINKNRVKHRISKSDIGSYRIKKAKDIYFNDVYVYDLSVQGVERFLCSGVLVHNSAGFQIASFKRDNKVCNIDPIDSLRWQEENADIAMNLDTPPTLYKTPPFHEFMAALKESHRCFEIFEKNRKNYDMKLYNVLHGEKLDMMRIWFDKVKDFNFDGWAIGMKPPFDPMLQALSFAFLYEKGIFDDKSMYGIHFFGTSGKHVVPTLAYMASKLNQQLVTYDSSSYNIGSIYRTYYSPLDFGPNLSFGEKFKRENPQITELPCMCPVCQSVEDIQDLNKTNIFAGTLISLHNLYQYAHYNNIVNSLVKNKAKFLEYLRTINASVKTMKSLEFIDYAMEKGVEEAARKYEEYLQPQDLNKCQQVGIFDF